MTPSRRSPHTARLVLNAAAAPAATCHVVRILPRRHSSLAAGLRPPARPGARVEAERLNRHARGDRAAKRRHLRGVPERGTSQQTHAHTRTRRLAHTHTQTHTHTSLVRRANGVWSSERHHASSPVDRRRSAARLPVAQIQLRPISPTSRPHLAASPHISAKHAASALPPTPPSPHTPSGAPAAAHPLPAGGVRRGRLAGAPQRF